MRNDEILKRAEEGMKESNKMLIRELVQDLENKGIPPVIAVDGEVKKLHICESEQKSFEKELKKFGLEKSDFCLLEEDCPKAKKPTKKSTKTAVKTIAQKAGNIFIIHKKSAKLKKYKACDKSSWVADLHRDLKNKFFTN